MSKEELESTIPVRPPTVNKNTNPSRPREASSLWTGVPLVSRLVSTTSPRLLYQEAIWRKCQELFACRPTQQPLLRPGPGWIISLILCMPSEPLSTGMLERAWRKVSFLRLEKTLLLLKKIMRRLGLTQSRPARVKEMSTRQVLSNTQRRLVYIFKNFI